MPGIVDSFLVEWILDPSKYIAGQKKLAEANKKTREDVGRTTDDIGQAGKRSAEFFSKLRNEAIGLFLAFQGASSVKSFVSDMIAGDATTGRLARNLNTSAHELSAWQRAVAQAGGEAADANAAFATMAQLLQNFQNTGLTGQEGPLRALGLMPGDLSNPAEALLKLADARERFEKADGGAGVARFYGLAKGLGIPDSVINTLAKGREELGRQITELERHGAATKEDTEAAEQFQKAWAELQANLASAVRPEIYKLVTTTLELVQAVNDGTVAVPSLSDTLLIMAGIAAIAGAPFVALGLAIAFVVTQIDDLKAAWKSYEDWYEGLSASTDSVFDPVRKALGMRTGAQARRDGVDVLGNPVGGSGGGGGGLSGYTGAAPSMLARPGAAAPQAGGDDVYQYFRRLGYTDEAARGIAAGVHAESTSDHNARNPTSGAHGLAQWLSKDRKRDFRATFGHDIERSTRDEQLQFIAKELRTTEAAAGKKIRNAKTSDEALRAFITGYERPAQGGETIGDIRRGRSYLAGRGAGGGAGGGNITIQGGVTVNTQATDANGIAKDMIPAIRRRATPTQANRGLD